MVFVLKVGHMRIEKSFEFLTVVLLGIHMLLLFFNKTAFFNLGGNSILYILIFLLAFFIFIKNKAKFEFPLVQLCCIIIVIISFLSIEFINPNYEEDMLMAILLFYCLLFFVPNIKLSAKNLDLLINLYIISAILLSLILIIQHRPPYESYGIFRYGIYYSDTEYYDVNFTGLYLVLPTGLGLNKMLHEKNTIKKMVRFFSEIILIFAIIFTGSRGATLVMVALLGYIGVLNGKLNLKRIILFFCAILILGICVKLILPADVWNRLFGEEYTIQGRRTEDWSYGIRLILNKPFWGNGIVSAKNLIIQMTGMTWITVHNTYLVYMVLFGIVGAIPFMGIIVYPIVASFRYKIPKLFLISYLGFMAMIMLVEANFSDIVLITLLVIYCVIHFYKTHSDGDTKLIDEYFR